MIHCMSASTGSEEVIRRGSNVQTAETHCDMSKCLMFSHIKDACLANGPVGPLPPLPAHLQSYHSRDEIFSLTITNRIHLSSKFLLIQWDFRTSRLPRSYCFFARTFPSNGEVLQGFPFFNLPPFGRRGNICNFLLFLIIMVSWR
jgi:hypothetical protein